MPDPPEAEPVEISGVDTDIFYSNKAWGGRGVDGPDADKIFLKHDKGAVMTKIQAWTYGYWITGVEMTMSNGDKELFGTKRGVTRTLDLSPGERLTELCFQASGETDENGRYHLGAIWMETSKNNIFNIRSEGLRPYRHRWDEFRDNSGIVYGMFGRYTDESIDCLGFAVMKAMEISLDIDYPDLEKCEMPLPTQVAKRYETNLTTTERTYDLVKKVTVTEELSWSGLNSFIEIHPSLFVNCIPVVSIGDETTTAKWTIKDGEYRPMHKETEDKEFKWTCPCPKESRICATGSIFKDYITTRYTCKVEFGAENGDPHWFTVDGTYTGKYWGRTELRIDDAPLKVRLSMSDHREEEEPDDDNRSEEEPSDNED